MESAWASGTDASGCEHVFANRLERMTRDVNGWRRRQSRSAMPTAAPIAMSHSGCLFVSTMAGWTQAGVVVYCSGRRVENHMALQQQRE